MSRLFFDTLSIVFLFSPPFLIFFIWRKFLKSHGSQRPRWKTILNWISILAVSGLFLGCTIAFFAIPCDVDRYGWECVVKWRSFTRIVVWSAPLFLALAAVGRNGTRILSIVLVIAVTFDCVLVDMMA